MCDFVTGAIIRTLVFILTTKRPIWHQVCEHQVGFAFLSPRGRRVLGEELEGSLGWF